MPVNGHRGKRLTDADHDRCRALVVIFQEVVDSV
jgi:hypothetical protein